MNAYSSAAGAYGHSTQITPLSDSVSRGSVSAAMLLDPRNVKKQTANGMICYSFLYFQSSLR